MTLIEVLFAYRELIRAHGRQEANQWLHDTCAEGLWEAIEWTVSDEGAFINALHHPIIIREG